MKGMDWPYWLAAGLILCLALYASNTKADTNIFVGAWSKHLISDDETLNEQHDLYAIEHNGWFAGTFTNSYHRESYAVARKFDWRYGKLEGGVYVGAVRGYKKCFGDDDSNTDTCPLAVPYLTWHTGPVNPQLFLLGEAVAVSIRIGF